MTYTITLEQFLAAADVHEEAELTALPDPLASIAESLRYFVDLQKQHEKADSAEQQVRNDLAELEEGYRRLEGQLDAIRAIIKPSTSKLANAIRDVLDGPTAEEPTAVDGPLEVVPEEETLPDEPAPYYNAPADDAPVETWREYARGRGFQGPDVDTANRSQIRTMLGIPQPVESA